MRISEGIRYLVVMLGAIATAEGVMAESVEIRMIELTEVSGFDRVTAPEAAKRKERRRAALLAEIAENRAEMNNNGFVLVSDQIATLSERLFNDVVAYQASQKDATTLFPARLAYNTIDPTGAAFQSADLVGIMPVESDDGSIHHMFYAFNVDEVGQLVIEELNFSTVTDAQIAVATPAGNIIINGRPGTYMVSINEAGTRAVSSFNFLTLNKMFTLTTTTRLDVGSNGYDRLKAIAESLY